MSYVYYFRVASLSVYVKHHFEVALEAEVERAGQLVQGTLCTARGTLPPAPTETRRM